MPSLRQWSATAPGLNGRSQDDRCQSEAHSLQSLTGCSRQQRSSQNLRNTSQGQCGKRDERGPDNTLFEFKSAISLDFSVL